MQKAMLKIFRNFILFALLFCLPSFAQDKKNDDVIKVETNLVNVPVIVSDRNNRYLAGLKAADFTVFQDGQKQKIEYFAAEESPINVAILLDTSRSTEQVLDKIQKAALEFIKTLKTNDRAMIVSFDWRVNVLSDLTNDREKLKRAVKSAEIGERFGTVLNDAVYQTINRSFAGVKGRKAVILLTDGKDFGSFVGKNELIYKLQESDALVYPVFYETGFMRQRMMRGRFPFPNRRGGNNERRRQRNERANENAMDFLEELASVTAGRFYEKDAADLSEAFEAIAGELRRQYLIGFYPENIEAGKVYRLKITVDRADAVVRAKNVFRAREN